MTPTRIRKSLIGLGAAAGVTLGGFAVAGMASAQVDTDPAVINLPLQVDPPADDGAPTPDTSEGEDGERSGGRGCGKHVRGAAEAIGITPEELREALDGGQTIGEVAEANGVDPQDVIDAIVANTEERLAGAVEDGRLTQEEADERLEGKTDRITDRILGSDDDAN